MILLFPILLPLAAVEHQGLFGFVFLLCLPATITSSSPLVFPLACSLHSVNLVGILFLIAEDEELASKQNSDPKTS